MIKPIIGTDDSMEQKAMKLIADDVLGVLPDYLYAIAHSNLPASEMFDFLLKHDIKGRSLDELIHRWFRGDLNLFTQALLRVIKTEFFWYLQSSPNADKLAYCQILALSPVEMEKKIIESQKTNDELLQEILEIL